MNSLLLTTWSFFRNIGYLFIIFILAFIIFNAPDQSKDFVLAFIDGSEPSYYVSVAILLFFWSYITWYSACIILEISPVNYQFINEKLAEYFCLFIGYIPSIIMAITFFMAHSVKLGFASLLAGLAFLLFFKWRDRANTGPGKWPSKVNVLKHNLNGKGEERTPSFREELKFIDGYPNVLFYFMVIGIFFLILLIILCIPSLLIWSSRTLRPAAVVILSITFLTYLFTVLFYFHDLKTRPFVFIILFWLVICSTCNDNTKVTVTRNFKDLQDFRLTPRAAFDKWYNKKVAAWELVHEPNDSMPVIFIATQGGGIRGEIWTSEVLNLLRDSIRGFYDQVFCIGGASGGTVGAVYYNAFVYDSLNNQHKNAAITFENFQKFTCADCISPVTASFVFGENLQRFLPWPAASLERSKIMMQAFSTSYYKHLKSGLTDSSFLNMYYPNDDSSKFNCDIPSLFVNGVLAETGQRVITSDLKIKDIGNFQNDIDFFDKVRGHITIATASLNCMRFPLLLSGGLFNKEKSKDASYSIGHIVDGGYRENTGLQAMYSLMSELKERFKGKPIKPFLIYLRNGGFEYDPAKEDSTNAMRLLHDIGTPVRALLNVNGTSVPALGIMKMIEQQQANDNPLNMYYNQIWLKDPKYNNKDAFPLGLYISDTACTKLRLRAQKIPEINTQLFEMLKHYFK